MYYYIMRSIFTGLLLCLSLHLLSCKNNEVTQRSFESQSWRNGGHQIRGQMAQDLIKRQILIGKTRNQAIKLLGKPDEEDKEFITYFIYLGNEFGPPPLVHVELDKRQTVKDVWITD